MKYAKYQKLLERATLDNLIGKISNKQFNIIKENLKIQYERSNSKLKRDWLFNNNTRYIDDDDDENDLPHYIIKNDF